ncbi:S24 family peptidase [Acinetobacter beijerinckii]|uniref:S24 family peptidase n=1 Tax=Acinetobacter beijerinckii TaxID=262668 RepID=UPI003AF57FFC
MSNKTVHPSMERVYQATKLETADLVKLLNETPQTIYNWESRGISKPGAFKISKKFKIDLGWILSGEGSPQMQPIYDGQVRTITKLGGWVPVKSYSKMGFDGYYTEMGYLGNGGDGYVPSLTAGPNAYAVKGTGDSMYPAIRNGWYVVCDPDAEPTPTEFVEVQLKDGRRTIKEFIGIVGDVLHLLAVNGEKRTTFDMDEVDAIVAVSDIVPPSKHVHDYPVRRMQNIYED